MQDTDHCVHVCSVELAGTDDVKKPAGSSDYTDEAAGSGVKKPAGTADYFSISCEFSWCFYYLLYQYNILK